MITMNYIIQIKNNLKIGMIMFNMDFIKIFLNGNYNLVIKKDLNLYQFTK